MSLLAVDIRNSHTVLGLIADGVVSADWRVSTGDRTGDEWLLLVRGLLGADPADRASGVTGVAVASTVPAALREWRQMLDRDLGDVPTVVVERGVRTGLPLLVDNPREVGTDRILNAVAALTAHGSSLVVDVGGTATTLDIVLERRGYLGGAIAPGIELGLEALGQRAAQLRQVELVRPETVVATNTVAAVQSGLVFGHAAQIDGLVTRMLDELTIDQGEVTVVATGVHADLVIAECTTIDQHDRWLTLRGLEAVFDRNC